MGIGEINISDEFLIWLAELGDGGKKVTKFYIQEGLRKIANYTQVDTFFKREGLSKEKQEELLKMMGWGNV